MAKEVKTRATKEDLKAEVERLKAKNNEIMAAYNEIAFRKKPGITESEEYKALENQLVAEKIKAKEAERLYRLEVEKREQLRRSYLSLSDGYNALKSEFEALKMEIKTEDRNARGAGRKPALSEEVKAQAAQMHDSGMSYREIAKEMGVSFSVIARACQKTEKK